MKPILVLLLVGLTSCCGKQKYTCPTDSAIQEKMVAYNLQCQGNLTKLWDNNTQRVAKTCMDQTKEIFCQVKMEK